jgi:hypothetical protein
MTNLTLMIMATWLMNLKKMTEALRRTRYGDKVNLTAKLILFLYVVAKLAHKAHPIA